MCSTLERTLSRPASGLMILVRSYLQVLGFRVGA